MAEEELERLIRKMNLALTSLSDARLKPAADDANEAMRTAVSDAYRAYEVADNAIRDYVFRLVGHRH